MTKVNVGPFACPICKATIERITVELEAIESMYKQTAKPVPVVVTCPKGHAIVAYLYTVKEGNSKKVLIRNVRPAVSSAEESGESAAEKNKDNFRKSIDDWLESL
ncbi:MAG: hypothetical protein ACP6IU_01350 [Candidatus Asgardarchaeia archaeon]